MAGGGSLRAIAQRAKALDKEWPRDAAEVAERAVTASVRAASGGDGALSHDKRGGAATVEVRGGAGKASIEGAGNMGTWAILESGTRPHVVSAGRGRVLRTPYGPRPTVNVSGTSGKKAWTRGVAKAMPDVARSAADAFSKVMS